ncbi:hypothetical protein JZ751_008850 [Albula glossodonta]|uniref:Uncharacterized protein n=1 Tax=Albula glossodonta TaxID=121402 RepID=A0A8T2P1U0_9TELE|nr:hypothetical protein JZ751_008850 [Albula glossodonta]
MLNGSFAVRASRQHCENAYCRTPAPSLPDLSTSLASNSGQGQLRGPSCVYDLCLLGENADLTLSSQCWKLLRSTSGGARLRVGGEGEEGAHKRTVGHQYLRK